MAVETLYSNQSVTIDEILDSVQKALVAATGLVERRVIEWHRKSRPDLDQGGTVIWFRYVDGTPDITSGAGRSGTKTDFVIEVNITTRLMEDGNQRDRYLMRRHLALLFLVKNAFYGRFLYTNYLPAVGGEPPMPSRLTPLSASEQESRRRGDPTADPVIITHGGTMTIAKLPEPETARPEQGYFETSIGVNIPVILRLTLNAEPEMEE